MVIHESRERGYAFSQISRGGQGCRGLVGRTEHLRGHAGHQLTRDEPLRVCTQIIGDARDGVTPATCQGFQSDAGHLGGRFRVLVESVWFSSDLWKFSGGGPGAECTDADPIAAYLL